MAPSALPMSALQSGRVEHALSVRPIAPSIQSIRQMTFIDLNYPGATTNDHGPTGYNKNWRTLLADPVSTHDVQSDHPRLWRRLKTWGRPMSILLLIALVAGAIAAALVWLFVTTGTILVWAVFLGWASFAAIGGEDRHIPLNVASNFLGTLMAWLVAVLALLNPAPQVISFAGWISILAGVSVVAYILASRIQIVSSIPAASIAYAGTFAYVVHGAGAFTLESLLSVSFNNALIIMPISMMIGTLAAVLVGKVVGALASSKRVHST